MSIGSETAEQMTREAIQISEAAAKLAALGAKNLAPCVWRWRTRIRSCGARHT